MSSPTPQFIHLQTYSMKGNKLNRSIKEVAAENSRSPGNMPHVEHPQPPVLLGGVDPMRLVEQLEEQIQSQNRIPSGRGRSIRRDTHTLMTAVLSFPIPTAELELEENLRWHETWKKASIKWVQEEFDQRGLLVGSIVEHLDEKYPHLHVLATADAKMNPRLDVKKCHPGHCAVNDAGLRNKKGGTALFKHTMRKWQDSYWDEVGCPLGLTRDGPRRKRKTRAQWKSEDESAKRLQKARIEAEELQKNNHLARQKLRDLEIELARLNQEESDLAHQVKNRHREIYELENIFREVDQRLEEETKRRLKEANEEIDTKLNNINSAISDIYNEKREEIIQYFSSLREHLEGVQLLEDENILDSMKVSRKDLGSI